MIAVSELSVEGGLPPGGLPTGRSVYRVRVCPPTRKAGRTHPTRILSCIFCFQHDSFSKLSFNKVTKVTKLLKNTQSNLGQYNSCFLDSTRNLHQITRGRK